MTNDEKESNKLGECIVVDQSILQQNTSSQTVQFSYKKIKQKIELLIWFLISDSVVDKLKKYIAEANKLIFSFSSGSIVTFLQLILTSMILAHAID